jgi:hypothetical protein
VRGEQLTARRTRGSWLVSPRSAVVLGVLVLALLAADPALALLARRSVSAANGSVPVWFSAAIGVAGFVMAWRKPRNPLGWITLAVAGSFALSQDASFYVVADYRLRHGSLPLGWVALLAQPGWVLAIVLTGLIIFLFPDGRPPSPRWRWLLWPYLGVAALWLLGAAAVTAIAIAGHAIAVDSGGNLLISDHPAGFTAWWRQIGALFLPVLALGWVASVAAQVLSWRDAPWERRQQLKWLLAGSVVAGAGLAVGAGHLFGHSEFGRVADKVALAGILAIPACLGAGVVKYRLYDIDRILSRTLGYAIIAALLAGADAGLVLLATHVLRLHTTVAVAAATLAAVALFTPLRRWVLPVVDRQFNRARYDADLMVAAFASRLQDAVDLDLIRGDLAAVVQQALEPAHISVWMNKDE